MAPRSLKILVAEDGRVNQMAARLTLEEAGHIVTIVEDGQQAIEAVESGQYDAVLMDVFMPNVGGLEATQRIRQHANQRIARIPIFAVTASAKKERDECLAVKADEVIEKPIDASTVSELLAKYVG